jgi:pyrimidine-specific ribonucleoside hydrolase
MSWVRFHFIHAGTFSESIYKPGNYTEDVRMILEETINKYGEEEWRRIALTVEIHGHLGVYAIIGAKMGILAKEILGGTESLTVVSFAGDKPPLSCLNDGIQVSTGATLGHGSIQISPLTEKTPTAVFSSGGQTFRISLKESIREATDRQIRELLHRCGGLTDEYWDEVRELGLNFWRDLDRKEIFEVIAG